MRHASSQIIHITWVAPFTLNLTNIEPDITYCIHIIDNLTGFNISINLCNQTETEFFYPIPRNVSFCCNNDTTNDECNITVTVIPVNGAGKGLLAQAHMPSNAKVNLQCTSYFHDNYT